VYERFLTNQDREKTMKLRRPQDELAGCCWLARMVDKMRASQQGDFPLPYRLSLGSPIGIDGFFLRHFRLSFRQFRDAVIQGRNDENLTQWFLSQPGVNASSLGNGNDFGPKQGTPGYPASLAIRLLQYYGTSL
jgi:hypothetical protein